MRLQVVFFRSLSGKEPVREWLQSLPTEDKKTIGVEIKTIQFGWPLGMPLVRKCDAGLWEIRVTLHSRIARILFTVEGNQMVLLHGFIKKTQKMPLEDLSLARERLARLRNKR